MARDLPRAAAGVNVRTSRKLHGLTQEQLAARMHVSASLLRGVEQGRVPASPSFVVAAAAALNVSTYDLYGQPEPQFGEERRDVDHLETAVMAGSALALVDQPLPERWLHHLSERVTAVAALKRRARYAQCAELLPELLVDLHSYITDPPDHPDLPHAHHQLATAYNLASMVLHRLGSPLAGQAAERAVAAGTKAGDENFAAFLDAERALPLIHRGAYDAADRILNGALDTIGLCPVTPPWHSVSGFLHLRLAILHARRSNAERADSHLVEARRHAVELEDPSDIYGSAFCLTNVHIHEVGAAVEYGDPTTALSRQRPVDPLLLPSRAGHYYVDLSRAWLLHGDREKAFGALHQARAIAPQLTRYNPQVRETLAVLAQSDRRRTDSLAGFARWAGVKI